MANGNTATPTLTIGNVHVGSTTYSYNIANTGTTGPALRGAIQTSVNGANLTDPRLSGSGVTAGNWGPLATGASLARDVVVTVGAAGSLAPLTGQSVAIVNNFENTRSQVLTFGLAAGRGGLSPGRGQHARRGRVRQRPRRRRREPGADDQQPRDQRRLLGKAQRQLRQRQRSAHHVRGGVGLLGAGASNSSSMIVGLNTAAAGSVNGTVIVNFASDGSGTSGLGITALPSQSVGVTGVIQTAGNVFRLASPSPARPIRSTSATCASAAARPRR